MTEKLTPTFSRRYVPTDPHTTKTMGDVFGKRSTLACSFYFPFICINKDNFWEDHQLNSSVIIACKKKKTKWGFTQ